VADIVHTKYSFTLVKLVLRDGGQPGEA